jgi:hypothetical protein
MSLRGFAVALVPSGVCSSSGVSSGTGCRFSGRSDTGTAHWTAKR